MNFLLYDFAGDIDEKNNQTFKEDSVGRIGTGERQEREISVLQDIERRHLLSIVAWGFEMREKYKGPY